MRSLILSLLLLSNTYALDDKRGEKIELDENFASKTVEVEDIKLKIKVMPAYENKISSAGTIPAFNPKDIKIDESKLDEWDYLNSLNSFQLTSALKAKVGDGDNYKLPQEGNWDDFPQAPVDDDGSKMNEITDEKVELGKHLFYETGLSVNTISSRGKYTVSCATCHHPEASFGAGTSVGRGIGEGGSGALSERRIRPNYTNFDFAPYNEMRLINVGYRSKISGWHGDFDSTAEPEDGFDISPIKLLKEGHDGLESFVYAALASHGLWDESEFPSSESVLGSGSPVEDSFNNYGELFRAAFGRDETTENYRALMTRTNTALAISAFLRTVVPNQSPFQQWLHDDMSLSKGNELSNKAKKGGVIFFGKAKCTSCHAEEGLTNAYYRFESLGTKYFNPDDPFPKFDGDDKLPDTMGEYILSRGSGGVSANYGRYIVTGNEYDKGKFTIPSVYGGGNSNVKRWGHGAYHDSLREFIKHKVSGISGDTIDENITDNLSYYISSKEEQWLTDEEIDAVATFIEEALEDTTISDVSRKGTSGKSYAGLCTPYNDSGSTDTCKIKK